MSYVWTRIGSVREMVVVEELCLFELEMRGNYSFVEQPNWSVQEKPGVGLSLVRNWKLPVCAGLRGGS